MIRYCISPVNRAANSGSSWPAHRHKYFVPFSILFVNIYEFLVIVQITSLPPPPPTVSLFPAFLSAHQLEYLLWFCFGFIWLFLFFMLFRYPQYCRYRLHHHLGFPVPFLQASDRVLFHQLQQHDAKLSHCGKHNYLSSIDPRLAAQESLKFSTVKI